MSSAGGSKDDGIQEKASKCEVENSEGCKRKRTQISLLEYFSKRKKEKAEAGGKGTAFINVFLVS